MGILINCAVIILSALIYWVSVPILVHKNYPASYDFVVVTDLDEKSRDASLFLWYSYLLKGKLYRHENGSYTVEWGSLQKLEFHTAKNNRSMELSELVKYRNTLYGMCDYTGIVFKISDGQVLQRYVIADGNGNDPKPMKIEWATIKDGLFYIGSIGKEWVDEEELIHKNAEWIKIINQNGYIEYYYWGEQYNALRKSVNASYPGYLIHEAVVWNPNIRKWIFLPRRHSIGTSYSVKGDETQGGNVMLIADENFVKIKVVNVGEKEPEWGFTSLKVIPDSNDLIAIKVKEVDGVTRTELFIFDLEGNIKSRVFVSDMKYEGLEFL